MIRNVHERVVDAPIERLGALLDGLGQKGDRLWPSQNWPPMVLDRPVSEGGAGGHGAIRYHVAEYEPGARVRFAFEPATGIDGAHELSLDELSDGRCRMRHVLVGRARGRLRPLFCFAGGPLPHARGEGLVATAAREATGTLARPAKWSLRVRLLRRLFREGKLATDNK